MAGIGTQANPETDELDEVTQDVLDEIQDETGWPETTAIQALALYLADVNLGEIIRSYQSREGNTNA